MKENVIKFVKIFSFVIIFLCILLYLNVLFFPKDLGETWESVKTGNSFYELEENSVEVMVCGASVLSAAVSPYQLYEEQGIVAYNLALQSQPMMASYYWLIEALEYQSPKVIILGIRGATVAEEKDEAEYSRANNIMRYGINKWNYALAYKEVNPEISLLEYMIPLTKFHSRWSQIDKNDYIYMSGSPAIYTYTRGQTLLSKKSQIEYMGITGKSDAIRETDSESEMEYLRKIIDFCAENGLELILTHTPDSIWKDSRHNLIQEVADEYQISFLDFNMQDLMQQIEFDYKLDANDDKHVNYAGADKITKYLGEYLVQNYSLTDFRTTEISIGLDKELEIYHYYLDNAILKSIDNVEDYLKGLDSNRYMLLLANCEGVSNELSTGLQESLMALGFTQEIIQGLKDGKGCGSAVFGNQTINQSINMDEINATAIYMEGWMNEQFLYELTSEEICSIVIDQEEQVKDSRNKQLNILVYDTYTSLVVECFGTVENEGILIIQR